LCYWDKQQSAESNITQFHLTLECTKGQSSNFFDCVLVSKWIFQHNDRGLTKFHAGSEQLLVCVVINNSSFPTIKNNNTAYNAFGKHWMQARGFLNYRLKYCLPKVIYCVCMSTKQIRTGNKKNWGGASQKLGGHGPPRPPLESPLLTVGLSVRFLAFTGTTSSPMKRCEPLPDSPRPPLWLPAAGSTGMDMCHRAILLGLS